MRERTDGPEGREAEGRRFRRRAGRLLGRGVRVAGLLAFLGAAAVAWGVPGTGSLAGRAALAQGLPAVTLNQVAAGLADPTWLGHAGDGSGRLFAAEQAGRLRIIRNGALLAAPFLDISDRVASGGELGLLGVAFPPGFAAKRYVYVYYTDLSQDTVVSRFSVTADPDVADPASEEVLLRQAQPFANHKGGQLAFGPGDGFLYIGLGDGGSAGDPLNNGQSLATLLGKILRLDTETQRAAYLVPASNPLAANPGARPEIWAYGLRNPWRFSFDRATGELWIADVGQDRFEEIDFQVAGFPGGANYGWRILEGNACYNPASGCTPPAGYVPPVFVYDHSAGGCSVTGGFVYRGPSIPGLAGVYLFSDYCDGILRGLRQVNGAWTADTLLSTGLQVTTFGEDEAGEVYLAEAAGTIRQIVGPAPAESPDAGGAGGTGVPPASDGSTGAAPPASLPAPAASSGGGGGGGGGCAASAGSWPGLDLALLLAAGLGGLARAVRPRPGR